MGFGTTRTGAISGTNPLVRIKGTGATSATSSLEIQDSAGATSLIVRDDGRVGIGTTTLNDLLVVNGGTGTTVARFYTNLAGYGKSVLRLQNLAGSTTEPGGVAFNLISGDFSAQFEAYHTGTASAGIAQFGTYNTSSSITIYAGNSFFNLSESNFDTFVRTASVNSVSEITNNSYVLIDEGGVLFSSRESMSKPNKLLSDLILIARHKNLNIIFISQNSSNLDVNILRQADYLVLKQSSLLQKDFERKIVQKIYLEVENKFEKHKNVEGVTYIHSGDFSGFISNSLPSFWKSEISKSFK